MKWHTVRNWLVALLALSLSGCGYLMQRASVSRNFSSRFGCQAAKVKSVGGGYRVEGCGQSAQYVCVADPPSASSKQYTSDYDDPKGEAVSALFFGLLFAGSNERCHFAYAQQQPSVPMPVASSAPGLVRRVKPQGGELVLKTRLVFAGGFLSARAKPSEHPAHTLLVVHGTARLPEGPCAAEIFHDGVAVPVLDQLRVNPYEVQLLVPIASLAGAERAVRFAGSVCGLQFELDPSGRSTLGLFAVHFHEELTRLEGQTAGASVTPAVK